MRLGRTLTLLASVSFVLAGCSSVIVVDPCEEGELFCTDGCTEVQSDPQNCGACGEVCTSGLACVDGVCNGNACGAGLLECNGTCIDPQNDSQNCGDCNSVCVDGTVCVAGSCKEGCAPGLAECSGQCVDLSADPNNCGDCGIPCFEGDVCSGGICITECAPPTEECLGTCVNTSTDKDNCGGCNIECPTGWSCVDFACEPPACSNPTCGLFCDVTELPQAQSFSTFGSTFGSIDVFSPACAPTMVGETAFRFTAPTGGFYQFDMVGSSYDTILSVLDANCETIDCNDDSFGVDAAVSANISKGDSVLLVIDGFATGDFQLNVEFVQGCDAGLTSCNGECVDTLADDVNCGDCNIACGVGDHCINGNCESTCLVGSCGTCGGQLALQSAVPQTVNGTIGQLNSGLFPSCGNGPTAEVGHTFTAPEDGTYTFSTAGSFGLDTVLTLVSGTCTELACDDNSGPGNSSRIQRNLTAGENVTIIVDAAFSGDYTLAITSAPVAQCPNQDLGSTVPQTISGSTAGLQNSFTPNCISSSAPDQQFLFTPPATGNYRFNTTGSSYDTVIYVLGGVCQGGSLACNDDFMGSAQGQVTVNLQQGVPVTVVVDGFGNGQGNFQLQIQQLMN